jgi:quercetin dioxygenase-like cupin family protein
MEAKCNRQELLEIRNGIKRKANVAMKWKGDKESICLSVPSDQYVSEIKNVHQRLCSLSDNQNMTVVNVIYNKGGYIAPHTHDRVERTYVLDGEYFDQICEKTFKKGDTQEIPANTLHASKSDYCLLTVTWQPAYKLQDI